MRLHILEGLLISLLALGCSGSSSDQRRDPVEHEEAVPRAPEPLEGEEPGEQPGLTEVDISVCSPNRGGFSTVIDNPYLPYVPGTRFRYRGTDEGAVIDLQITVLDEVEVVAGVTTRVVEEREWEDSELIEVSRNYFAQAADGTVCYFGEDVDIYEDGKLASHDGAWRADVGANQPGIMMPAAPAEGMTYLQESAPGVALDRARIVLVGGTFKVPGRTFGDTLTTEETTTLEPGSVSNKAYAKGIGLVFDDPVALVEVTKAP